MGCKVLRDKLKDNFARVKKMDKLTIVLYWKSQKQKIPFIPCLSVKRPTGQRAYSVTQVITQSSRLASHQMANISI